MPSRVARGQTARSRAAPAASGRKKATLGGPLIAPRLKLQDELDTTRLRGDGSLLLGRRANGPGEVLLSEEGELLLEGQKGLQALIETARLIEMGVSPFAHATEAQRTRLLAALKRQLEPAPTEGKSSTAAVLKRSALATLMLSLARSAQGALREGALGEYVALLATETHVPLKVSMLANFDAAHLPLKKPLLAKVESARQGSSHGDGQESQLGPERFFDPGRRAHGGAHAFRPAMHAEELQALSPEKIDHAVAQLGSDFVAGGWFSSDSEEPVRVMQKVRESRNWFELSVNSRYADKSREVIASMMLFEVARFFDERDGRVEAQHQLRALLKVGRYLEANVEYSDVVDELLSGFARRYGFRGPLDSKVMREALKRDDPVEALISAGVSVG
ncbi:MAG: hypothetical protein IPJ65_41030 [Archangiaceae bacterium]|nr:hypothetical protein [Archangiaceae bacterium]